MPLHLEKKAIRALGVAESFSQLSRYSTLAGIVMRSDLVVDGFALGQLKVSGSDATDRIASLYVKLKRNDINVLLLSGSVLSLYNIIDVDELHERISVPIVALTFKKSTANLERNVQAKFPSSVARPKIALLRRLGTPAKVQLSTGYPIFVRAAGASLETAKKILDKFTLQGAIPEPIRVARLLARSAVSSLRARKI
jgi:uncharacterized protein